MERKFFVGGNWKMNGSKASIDGILKTLAEADLNSSTGWYHHAAFSPRKRFNINSLLRSPFLLLARVIYSRY